MVNILDMFTIKTMKDAVLKSNTSLLDPEVIQMQFGMYVDLRTKKRNWWFRFTKQLFYILKNEGSQLVK